MTLAQCIHDWKQYEEQIEIDESFLQALSWEESATRSNRRRSRVERTSALCSGGWIGSCLITIGSSVGLQNVPHRSLPLLSSSFALSFFFSCFVFTVEYTWCCLGIAWVGIDFSSLCSVGGCLAEEFRDTQGFVVAFVPFPRLHSGPAYLYITKMPYLCMLPTWQDALWMLPLPGVTVWRPQGL